MNIDKTKLFLIAVIILVLGYLLNQLKYSEDSKIVRNPAANQEVSVYEEVCLEETNTAINFYVNAEKSIFDKARAVVAMKNNPCLAQYPNVVSTAVELVNKERSTVNTAERGVDALVEFEGVNGLRGFETEATALEEALNARTYSELEKIGNEL